MNINQLLQDAASTQSSVGYIFFLAFLAGVLVSFTPCLYPMIPITAGILQAQARTSILYNFLSSLAYVIGIASIYATLGYLSATTAIIFGKWLANPWFILCMTLFFLYLAGSMFGLYEMYIPSLLVNRNSNQKNGSLLQSFILGALSGTVASPCLTPALALLLGIAAKQGNPILGFFTLFSFSMGMGVLLLLIGTFSSTLTMLPRAGEWMELFKKIFGFLMLGVCAYFLQPFVPALYITITYTLLAAIAAVYYLLHAKQSTFALALGILLIGVTCFLLTGFFNN